MRRQFLAWKWNLSNAVTWGLKIFGQVVGCITENLSKAVMWSFSVIDLITNDTEQLCDSGKFHEEDN